MGKYKRNTSLYEYCINENKENILLLFDYEKNTPKTPNDFTRCSDKKAYFKYQCGHSVPQRIADISKSNNPKCPRCLNRNGIGKSLASEYPDIAEMFDEKKNGIKASEISHKNGNYFWWICNRCKNSFRGKISDVVTGHRVCGECNNKRRSYPEYCLEYYFKKAGINIEINKKIEGYKFDLYLEKYNLAIEYDGYPWHDSSKAVENDFKKDQICKRNKIVLFRIRDNRLKKNDKLNSIVWEFEYDYKLNFLKTLSEKLEPFLNNDAKKLDVDIERDYKKVLHFKTQSIKDESLLAHMPILIDYIDYEDERNGNPQFITNASHTVRFWLRHPKYKNLKWSMTAHDLFRNKQPFTQRIKMCLKLLNKYPELENQICKNGNNIRETSDFTLVCTCGNKFTKTYAALINKNNNIKMCQTCLNEYRINNLKRYRMHK